MLKTIIVAAFVGIVILVECMLAYSMIPSQADVEAWADAKAKSAVEDAHGHGEEGHGGESKHEVEVDLGKYNVVVHQPAANVTLRVNFHLIGTVPHEEHKEFEELFAANQHRLRDQVLSEIRNSEVTDLTDPGLGLIKRKILAKTNVLLGKPILRTVVFSDFAFIEQ